MAAPGNTLASLDDLIARGDHDRLEIIGGEIVEKAAPSPNHSFAEGKLVVSVDPFNRRPGPRGPGGWWIFPEIHVQYEAGEMYCHDVAGWRRDERAERPTTWPVRARPDWVCEIVSPKRERTDHVDKPRVLFAAGVPHYWILDPMHRTLLVHRWSADGYVIVQRATAGETVHAEPFEAVAISVGEPPHAIRQSLLAALLHAHVRGEFHVAVEMLTRTTPTSDQGARCQRGSPGPRSHHRAAPARAPRLRGRVDPALA